jgi:hypothetical protein
VRPVGEEVHRRRPPPRCGGGAESAWSFFASCR